MTTTDDPTDQGGPDPGDDLGEPIRALAGLEEVPSSGFLMRLLGALRRRDLSAQLGTLGWTGLGTVFVEFLKVLFTAFDPNTNHRGGSD